jgi:hypothetical protein
MLNYTESESHVEASRDRAIERRSIRWTRPAFFNQRQKESIIERLHYTAMQFANGFKMYFRKRSTVR